MKTQTSSNSQPVRLFTEKYVENLENIFKNLYKDEVLCDVTFHCKDGSVRAHKAILATSSAYFRKIFYEHSQPETAYIMYGISVKQMRSFIELIYRGTTEVPGEIITSLYEMVEEMGVKGVICDENMGSRLSSPSSTHSRDTRYRGTKRVAVNFQEDDEQSSRKAIGERKPTTATTSGVSDRSIRRTSSYVSSSESSSDVTLNPTSNKFSLPFISNTFSLVVPNIEKEDGAERDRIETTIEHEVHEIAKKTSWQLKQRKFKCQLCPAGFKRASHLSRHQLVHTGERPWACTLCDKAFSRHDKLKHHIKKNHEDNPESQDSECMAVDADDSLYTIGHVQILTPSLNGTYEEDEEPSNKITREDLEPQKPNLLPRNPSPQEEISIEEEAVTPVVPQKKGRGRPRKYPPGLSPWPQTKSKKKIRETKSYRTENKSGKRGQGRPKKLIPPSAEGASLVSKVLTSTGQSSKVDNRGDFVVLPKQKKRGRPEKCPPVILKLRKQTCMKQQQKDVKVVGNESNAIIETSSVDSGVALQKRRPGRPRKYPPVPKPLFKRPRGRPRLSGPPTRTVNPYVRQPVNILPKPGTPGRKQSNYDITNMPFGDLETLMSSDTNALMEPYVEIKTEHQNEDHEFTDASENSMEKSELPDVASNPASSFLENIGLSAVKLQQIGQCTISLTGSTGCSTGEGE